MKKEIFKNNYFMIVHSTIDNLFEDYDLFIIRSNKKIFYNTYYSLPMLLKDLPVIYKEVNNNESSSFTKAERDYCIFH